MPKATLNKLKYFVVSSLQNSLSPFRLNRCSLPNHVSFSFHSTVIGYWKLAYIKSKLITAMFVCTM